MVRPGQVCFGKAGRGGLGLLSSGVVVYGAVGQASLGELGYVLYCGEVSRGISR